MGNTEIESKIREVLVGGLDVPAERLASVSSETPLIGSGIGLDSVEAMTLVSELEAEFEIHFADDELTKALFQSLGSLSAAVATKCDGNRGQP